MKQLLMITAACAFMIPAHSQGPESYTEKKNEINIGFFNAFELSNFSDLGVGYKRVAKNGAWRVGTGLGFSNSTSEYDNGGFQTHRYHDLSPRIGREWHQNFNRLQLQYGTDLVTDFFKSTLEDTNENIDFFRLQERTSAKYSIRPFLGLKVFLSPSISISTETWLDLGYLKETFEEVNNSAITSTRTEKGASVALGPLGVFSLNFHF